MNVLIATPTFLPIRGGTEHIVFNVAKRMAHAHKVVILTPQRENAPLIEEIENCTVLRFPVINKPLLDMISGNWQVARMLPKLHEQYCFDLIHQFHLYQIGGAVVRFAKKRSLPLITTLIGWDTYDPIRPVPKLLNPYLAWVMNQSSVVTTSSDHMIESAKLQGCKQTIRKIVHGTSFFKTESSAVNIREKYNLGDKKIIIAVQRLVPRKGLPVLMKAAKSLLEKRNDVVFLICGKGPLQQELEQQCKDAGITSHVVFAGFVPDEELKDHYQQSDLFVLSSHYEGFGLVVVDALASGVPVVTTRCGGPEGVVHENNGLFAPVGDAAVLAEQLSAALDRSWDRAAIVRDARQYDLDTIVENYESVYQEVKTPQHPAADEEKNK